jgi:putative transcriptional regulator
VGKQSAKGSRLRIAENHMSGDNATKAMANLSKHDWSRFDSMTEAERAEAARSDPDAQLLMPADMKRMKRTPRAKIIRRALSLTQEEFADRYGIPLGTLRDWEQGRSEPDQTNRSYLRVIASDPEGVMRALRKRA